MRAHIDHVILSNIFPFKKKITDRDCNIKLFINSTNWLPVVFSKKTYCITIIHSCREYQILVSDRSLLVTQWKFCTDIFWHGWDVWVSWMSILQGSTLGKHFVEKDIIFIRFETYIPFQCSHGSYGWCVTVQEQIRVHVWGQIWRCRWN